MVQGSYIDPTLSSIFINDLCNVIKHAKSSQFADDLKISDDVGTPECREFLKQDVGAVYDWSVANKLPISIVKCVALHYGRNNVNQAYTINHQIITESDNCLNLSVRRCNIMKYEHNARDTAHKAARLSGMVMKLFCARDPSFMTRLYTSYIRPVLEYAAPVWYPSGKGVIMLLERVQRSYTKRIRSMWYLSYDQLLECLRLPSLKKRRLINDLVLVYKSLHGQYICTAQLAWYYSSPLIN